MKHGAKWITIVCLFSAFTCPAFAGSKVSVFVSVLPQKYFVQQICNSLVDVNVMVQPGASPSIYEPKPSQMAALSKARIYFAVGAPFEQFWLEKFAAANREMLVVHTDKGIKKRVMAGHHHHGKNPHETDSHHEEGHEDEPQGEDPHVWLSPRRVITQVNTMVSALKKADPAHADTFEKNGQAFVNRIRMLDKELTRLFAGRSNAAFMVFHPSWGYFADDYGLEQVAIETEGKEPKPAQLRKLIAHAREDNIRVIFAQPQFSVKSAELIAREINARVVFADPLALEWTDNLRKIAHQVSEALR